MNMMKADQENTVAFLESLPIQGKSQGGIIHNRNNVSTPAIKNSDEMDSKQKAVERERVIARIKAEDHCGNAQAVIIANKLHPELFAQEIITINQ
jgi:hypothetical protein